MAIPRSASNFCVLTQIFSKWIEAAELNAILSGGTGLRTEFTGYREFSRDFRNEVSGPMPEAQLAIGVGNYLPLLSSLSSSDMSPIVSGAACRYCRLPTTTK